MDYLFAGTPQALHVSFIWSEPSDVPYGSDYSEGTKGRAAAGQHLLHNRWINPFCDVIVAQRILNASLAIFMQMSNDVINQSK